MASVADIPDDLLSPGRRNQLADWLGSLPIPVTTKRRFVRIWEEHVRIRLNTEQYARATANNEGP